jgi:nucleotide-binding universal stress UspA family protein
MLQAHCDMTVTALVYSCLRIERSKTMFKRMVVPLDGSIRAEGAIPVAARIARASGGTIILLQVVTIPLEIGSQVIPLSGFSSSTMEKDIDAATNYLAAIARSEHLDGVEVKMKVLTGVAAPTILDVVVEEQADLVVICSHGDTGIKRWMLGSVAQKIARQSTVPVLVLRQDGSVPTSSYPDHLRPLRALMALVALDGSALAEAALLPAATLVMALAAPARGTLQLTRVVQLPVKASEPAEQGQQRHPESVNLHVKEQAIREAKTYLGNLVEYLRQGPFKDANLTLTWSVATGKDVAETLIKAAETGEDADGTRVNGGCDLLVLATHGRGGLERLLLGSVTEHILGATRLPMLIIRPHEHHTTIGSASMEVEAR